MELVGLVLITILVFTLGSVVFDLTGPIPAWAVAPE